MKLVIHTQFCENYGAHDWDGEGECPQRWKFKGGETYVIEDVLEHEIEPILQNIKPLLEYDSECTREYVISHHYRSDDSPVCEEWEYPYVLECRGEFDWWATQTYLNSDGCFRSDIESKTSSYRMLPEGKRADYSATYKMKSGSTLTYDELLEHYAKADA